MLFRSVVSASRFIQKTWNIYRFSLSNLGEFGEKDATAYDVSKLKQIDFWLLSKLNGLIEEATAAMEVFKFDDAFKSIRVFAWETLADNYIELVKGRLYGSDAEGKDAAKFTLFNAVLTISKLLAPFTPFLAEEMYSRIGAGSVHQQIWPEKIAGIPADAEEKGELIKGITSAIRGYKSNNKIALNAPLKKIEIYNAAVDATDIASTVTSPIDMIEGVPDFEYVPTEVMMYMSLLGPMFGNKVGAVAAALKALPPKDAEEMKNTGIITINVAGESIELSAHAIEIKKEIFSAGREIDLIHVDDAVVVIVK